jgi:hypothetical protein
MNPLLLNFLRSEILSRAAPYAPSGIQSLLPQTSLGQQITSAVDPLLYLTGLKQHPTPENLPEDYMVSPTGILDSAGNQMITGQGVINFQPINQYGLDMGFNPEGPMYPGFETGSSQGPGGYSDNPFQQTQIDPKEYEHWFNPVPMPDLTESLPSVPLPNQQPPEQSEEEEDSGPFGILSVAPQLQNVFAKQNALQQR